MNTNEIVQKLWSLCNVLRDDGITYHAYVTELTYLLFLKMAQETGTETGKDPQSGREIVHVPKNLRWNELVRRDGNEQLNFYRRMLVDLGTEGSDLVQQIFINATTSLREPRNLKKLVTALDDLDWFSAQREGLGDLYEGLLEKNARESKSGAGQYFTPRPLINTIVRLIDPKPGERIQDPAAGTGGFIIAADQHIKDNTDDLFELDEAQQHFQRTRAFQAVELVPDTHRLGLMNMMLHDIHCAFTLGDSLSPLGSILGKVDVILTNPPFGTKRGGGKPTRDDFTFPTSNKQLAFLQHIYRGLKPGGRAAVVLPDNVLFEENTGQQIRTDLMNKCNLHTILRLPTGIFYAPGVKTNVLFFERGESDENETEEVWMYDMRTNMRSFGKRSPLVESDFDDFVAAYTERKDQGEEGRFRVFSRQKIRDRGDNLDITWLHDDDVERVEDLPPPEDIASEIIENLNMAMEQMQSLITILEGEEDVVV